jgi:hypothetical protein
MAMAAWILLQTEHAIRITAGDEYPYRWHPASWEDVTEHLAL